MTTWAYNNNTNRRGVWHIVENIQIETIPERTYETSNGSMIFITPEHKSMQADAICNQVTIHQRQTLYTYTKSKNEKGQRVETANLQPLYMVEGDAPPGPVCSRCEAKVNT
jgi:hypothetical protein